MPEPTPSDVYSAPRSGIAAPPVDERRWSRWGIASLIVGFVGVSMLAVAIALGIVWEVDGEGTGAVADAHATVVGLIALSAGVDMLVGVALAIAGLRERDCKRRPAIIGLVVNAFVLLSIVLMVVVGRMVDS